MSGPNNKRDISGVSSGHYSEIGRIFKSTHLSEIQKELLLKYNDTRKEYPKDKLLHELFEEQVEKTPDNVALIFEDRLMTYKELNENSNKIARVLRHKGVQPDSIVVIIARCSFEMIMGIVAIIKAGGAYLPIDTEYPYERINYMLEDSKADLLLTYGLPEKKLQFQGEIINLENEILYKQDGTNLVKVNKSSDLAYVIYTSGSTGKPKGIMIEHKSIINTLYWRIRYHNINENDTILLNHSICFDISVSDIFCPLLSGAKLVMVKPERKLNIRYLGKLIKDNNVSHFAIVPTFYKLLLVEACEYLQDVRAISIVGEHFAKTLVEEHFRNLPTVRLFNEYGPTETSVFATAYELSTDNTDVLIGKPINNTKCYIFNESDHLPAIGAEGELCIAGDGLARGYLNNSELTDEKFVPNPLAPGQRIYKTGDLVRRLPNGNIEFLGRIDHQVKIRGFRIELGEIEYQLLRHEKIKDVAVIAREDRKQNKYLCAYVISDQEITASEIRDYLSTVLPDYMIPAYFVQLEEFPLTPNGKLDRNKLPEPNAFIDSDGNHELPGSEQISDIKAIESKIVSILKNNVGLRVPIDEIDLDKSLRDLGMNSISYVTLLVALETEFGFEFDEEILDNIGIPNIKTLASAVPAKLAKV